MKITTAPLGAPVAIDRDIVSQALWTGTFAALTAIGAQIQIPHQPVPYTLQTFFVLLGGALLGKRNGAISQIVYLGLGAIGVPVFSGWGCGFLRLVGPTGGYLLAFPVAAYAVGYIAHREKTLVWSLLSMTAGMFIVFTLGTIQLDFVYFHNLADAVKSGFLIFSWWDVLKLIGAALVYRQLAGRVRPDSTRKD
ncbi:MAG: biotin transporter BioY [Bacteroidota bacterium]